MFSWSFWRATLERAIRTIAQTWLALWAGAGILNAFTIDPGEAFGVGLGAALLSLLTSVVAEQVSPATGPSLGTEKPVAAPRRKRTQAGYISGGIGGLQLVGLATVVAGALVHSIGLVVLGFLAIIIGLVLLVVLRR